MPTTATSGSLVHAAIGLLALLAMVVMWHPRLENMSPGDGEAGVTIAQVGGRIATMDRYPWMAKVVGPLRGPGCGGVLISPVHVLTARHCILDAKDGNNGDNESVQRLAPGLTVIIGSHKDQVTKRDAHGTLQFDVPPSVEIMTVRAITIVPFWTAASDWAILTLTRASTQQPVKVDGWNADVKLQPGMEVWSAGYGSNDVKSGRRPTYLQENVLHLLKVKWDFLITHSKPMPGFKTPHRHPYSGDSGGPLVVRGNSPGDDVLIGVVSNGGGEAGAARTSGFARTRNIFVNHKLLIGKLNYDLRRMGGFRVVSEAREAVTRCGKLVGRVRRNIGGKMAWKCPPAHPWDSGVIDQKRIMPPELTGQQCAATPDCASKMNRLYRISGAQVVGQPRYNTYT